MIKKYKLNKELIIPAVIAVLSYLIAYYLPKLILINATNITFFNLPIDDKIKMYSPSLIVYFGAFLQWANAILFVSKQKKEVGYKYYAALIIGSFVGMAIFLIIPNGIVRVEITGTSFFDNVMRLVYDVDSIVNALPSFHCMCSTLTVLAMWGGERKYKATLPGNIIFSILVYASTLLTKQHYLLDVIAGILHAVICTLIARKLTFTKLFDSANRKLIRFI